MTKGFIHDSISDMLTRIKNACLAQKATVSIPFTRINQQIAQILEKEGFIQTYQIVWDSSIQSACYNGDTGGPLVVNTTTLQKAEVLIRLKYRSKKFYKGKKKESCIINLKRISKPGLRIYANHKEIPRILGGTGIVIVSTPEGLLTDREARLKGLGGELFCSVW
nr:ribosomal protein S8 [Palmellopsis texensis]